MYIREELKTTLAGMQTETEKNWRQTALSGRGPTNHMTNLRLFDAPEGTEPKITLYRDTAGWCPYCQKVCLFFFIFF
jgi:glutathione S-transferase